MKLTRRSGSLHFLLTLALLAVFTAAAQGQAKELHIAAAADLQPVMPTLAQAYEHATGIKIVASFGSTATLTQQLMNGDPQDVFLAADFTHPEQLVAANLTVEHSPVPYASGVLVLWARKDSPVQPLTLDALTDSRVQKIAVANDQHAPYGVAATKALAALHLTDKVAAKLVIAENIAQTAQFAESGNAQVALISLTIASSPHFREIGNYILIPRVYPALRQCGVTLKTSKNQSEAQDFLRWLTSNPVQEKLKTMGLDPAN